MLIVIIKAIAGHSAGAKRILEEARALIDATRQEPGCLDYSFGLDSLDERVVRVTERWRSPDDMAQHMTSAHLGKFMAFLQSVQLSEMTAKVYDATGERDLF